jgi:sodium ion-translocating decarboxylase beta subunit
MFGLYQMAFGGLTWGNLLMLLIGGGLIYLGVARKMEPILLVPIGLGIMMVNIPFAGLMVYAPAEPGAIPLPASGGLKEIAEGKIGVLNLLYQYGLESEIIPLLIFLGIGALSDFSPAIARPLSFMFGATAQLGVFVVFLIAYLTGWFSINEAVCIGIIGGSDGPPTVYLTVAKAPQLLGPITLVAYSYMALVPILQPPIMRLLTTKKERQIYMKPQIREVSKLEKVIFPIVVFVVAALLVPASAPLIGMLMFGNLLSVTGVTDRLAESAGGVFVDLLTFLFRSYRWGTDAGGGILASQNSDNYWPSCISLCLWYRWWHLGSADSQFILKREDKPVDWCSRCLRGSYGRQGCPDRGAKGELQELLADACHGAQHGRCYRYLGGCWDIHVHG